MKGLRLYLVSAMLGVMLLAGCAHTPMNLAYQPVQKLHKAYNIKVAIVRPVYTGLQGAQGMDFSSIISNMMRNMNFTPDVSVPLEYRNKYSIFMANSMTTDLDKIISSKGMIPYKTFNSYDEVSYRDKKNVDLILQPEFDFGPMLTNHHTWVFPLFWPVKRLYWDHGTMLLGGKLRLVFSEPMSKEKILIKDIDISSLGLDTTMSYCSKTDAENKLVNFINKIYPLLMTKVERVIDPDEIAASMSDIHHLKQEKE